MYNTEYLSEEDLLHKNLLELGRNLSKNNHGITKLCGCEFTKTGSIIKTCFIDNLEPRDKTKMLSFARSVVSAQEVKTFPFKSDDKRKLIAGMELAELNNEPLNNVLYEQVKKYRKTKEPFVLYIFKGHFEGCDKQLFCEGHFSDVEAGAFLYRYLIGAVVPIKDDGKTAKAATSGFIYPSFKNRDSGDKDYVDIYQKNDKGVDIKKVVVT